MTKPDDIIAKKLETGEYYKDAREWYADKYLYPITERSYYLIFFLIIAYTFFSLIIATKSLKTEEVKEPFIVYADNSTDYFSKISPLIEQGETPQQAIAEYLITDYLLTREEYIHTKMHGESLKRMFKKIKTSSTKPVFTGYQNYMSKNNPYSPLVRYRDHTNRTISIKDFTFASKDLTNGKAEILFEATENSGYETRSNLWKALIHFRLPNVEVISKSGIPLRFVVSHYKIKHAEQ